ncbi:MAG: UvrD-helicase domain-containing protein, partial [Fusobacteriaceae bacterium]
VEIVEEMLDLTEILREKIVTEIYNNKMLPYENQVLGFIEELYRAYDEIKIKEGKLTFNDISTYTYIHYKNSELNLFEGEKITEYFKELFDSDFKVFFIDEFQDTSILQWKLLSGIAEISETAFFVGDEKQSLYSWRGGEKELFEKLSGIISGSEENLEICYRSKKNIIDFTNRIFMNVSKIYEEKEIKFNSSWNFKDVESIKNENSYVEIVDLTVEKKAEEYKDYLEKVVEILKSKFDGDYKDIAIIGRTSKELEEMGVKLSDNRIPYTLKSNSNIFKHRANISLYRLLKYFALDDYFSLLEFLRGDLIKLQMDSLKYLLTQKETIKSYLNCHESENLDLERMELKNEEQHQLKELLDKIKSLKKLYHDSEGEIEPFIIEIFKSFGTMELYKSVGDIKNYYKFLEICKGFETVSELVKAGETNSNNPMFSQVSVEDKNAVTLITVHASKGLEYHTVFFLHNPKKTPPDKNKMSFNIQLDDEYKYLKEFLILNNSHKKTLETKSVLKRYEFISEKEIKKLQEEINGWYVALTRAKQNLFIILAGEKENSILKEALLLMENSVGEFMREVIVHEKNEDQNKLELMKIDLSPNLIDPETLSLNYISQSEQLKNTEIENEKNLLMGTAVHYFLENINYLEKEELEAAEIKTLSKYGVELGFEKLKNIFKSEKFIESLRKYSEVFSKKWDFIHKEYEIKLNGKLKIIDRMMIKTFKDVEIGEIQIIDYKTGKREQEQLEEYEAAVFEVLLSQGLEKKYKIT